MNSAERCLKIVLSVLLLAVSTRAQNWNLSDAPNFAWFSMAGSQDGKKLVAASLYDTNNNPGLIYASTNSGQNWFPTSAPSNIWYAVASSADGSRLVACGDGDDGTGSGPICLSTNVGSSWVTSSAPITSWQTVASSTNGQILVGAVYGDGLYVSTNFGSVWNQATNAPNSENWYGLAISGDGSKIFATYDAGIYVSTNKGATWNVPATTSGYNWQPVACSQDGQTVFAGNSAGDIFYSTNSGTVWNLNTNAGGSVSWQCLAASTNGNTLIAGAGSASSVYVSANAGNNWRVQYDGGIPNGANWTCAYASANGETLAAGIYGGAIYYSVPVPVPSLSIQTTNNHAIISWPAYASNAGYILQTIGALNPSANWTNITTGITLIGTNNVYTNSLIAHSAFFRMAHP